MSFLGSIAAPLRKILATHAKELAHPVLLPCAGNFTIGAALRSGGYAGLITGCDITLYTSALGYYLANEKLEVSIKDDCPEHLRDFIDTSTPERLAASVALMLDLRRVWKNNKWWHRRTLTNFIAEWPMLMEKTAAKLVTYKTHLSPHNNFQYQAYDAAAFLDKHDKNHAVFIAPPTFGSRDYINQEKMLAASVTWNSPTFQEISFKDVEIYEKITSFNEWMIVMERPLPEIEKILGEPVAVVHKGRKSITYAYAGQSKKTYVTRAYLSSSHAGAIFSGNEKLTGQEKTGIVLLDKAQSVRMNELFMSVRVDYFLADVALSLGLCLDKKIIGKLDFNLTTHAWALPEKGLQIYQRSDLAVPSVEPRLAKLVLMLVQSHEVKMLIDEKLKDDFKFTVTTAFSKHPVSMKYRGIFELHKRIEDKESGGYRLNYFASLGQWSLEEGYKQWLKKFHK